MATSKPYLIHRPKKYMGKDHRGGYLAEFGNFHVDKWWILTNYGRPVFEILERDGKYEDQDKEIVIVKIDKPAKEAT